MRGEGRGDIGWVVAFNLREAASAPASSERIMAELHHAVLLCEGEGVRGVVRGHRVGCSIQS